MFDQLKLKNVMTSLPYSVTTADSVSEARKAMNNHNVRHLPVRDGDEIVGILTDRDVNLAASLIQHVGEESDLTVKDICTTDPYKVDSSEGLGQVLKYMGHNRIGSALVTENDKMIGIITTTDICQVCGEFIEEMMKSVRQP